MSTIRVDTLQSTDSLASVDVKDIVDGLSASTAFENDIRDSSDPAKGAALVGYNGRNVYDKLREEISVKDYGAVGNGIANDTVAIQAAIDRASALGGKTVYIPEGNYKLSTQGTNAHCLTVPSNVTLRGAGYSSYLFIDPTSVPSTTVAYVIRIGTSTTPASNIEISSLRINGNQVAIGGPLGSQTKYIQGISCRLEASPALLTYSENVNILNNYIEDVNIGVGCSKDSGIAHSDPTRIAAQHRGWTVSRNTISTTTNKAIELAECQSSAITDNQCKNVVDGPQVICASRDVTISNNVVLFKETGINVTHNSRRITVANNVVKAVQSGSLCGIVIRTEPYADASAITEVSVTGNTVVDDFTSGGGTSFGFLTKSANISAQFIGISVIGNVFTGVTRIYDIALLNKAEIRDLEVQGNRMTQLASLSLASDNVTQVNVIGNSIVLPYTHNSDNWTILNNAFKGAFALGASSSRTYHSGNKAPSFSDSSTSANNRQGVNEYAATVQRVESGVSTSSGTNPFAITFSKQFATGTTPRVTITVVSATAGSEVNLAAVPTNTGFTIASFSGGAAAARTFHWTAVGVD